MKPKSQISSGYIATKASAPGAQQLTLKSSSTLHRSCNLRVRSAQAISPLGLSAQSPVARFEEFVYSTQVMQPKSQISSGYIATKASAPGAQQLTLKSSSTLHRSCNLRVRSTQAISPLGLSAQSPATQNDELNHSTQAMQPRSQFSLDYSAHEPTSSVRRSSATQLRTCYSGVNSA